MSTQVTKAIYQTLTGASCPATMSAAQYAARWPVLTGLLGQDPRDSGPAVGYANKSQAPPSVDCVVIRCLTVNPDKQCGQLPLDDEFYELEAWTHSRTAGSVDAVFEAMDPLIHLQQLVLPSPETGEQVWKCIRIAGGSPALYDQSLRAWWGFWRYIIRHGRNP